MRVCVCVNVCTYGDIVLSTCMHLLTYITTQTLFSLIFI